MRNCTRCGTTLNPDWRFCGDCGATVEVVAPVAVAVGGEREVRLGSSGNGHAANGTSRTLTSTARTSGDSGWSASSARSPDAGRFDFVKGRGVRFGAALMACLIVVAALVVHLNVRSDLDSTREILAATASRLDTTSATLAETEGTLATTEENLTETTAERNNLQSEVKILQGRLAGIQGSLDDARDQMNLQAGQITTLKACLSGVSIALTNVLKGDYYGAAAALRTVQQPCREAFSML